MEERKDRRAKVEPSPAELAAKVAASNELRQELELCRERMSSMKVSLINMNNEISSLKTDFLYSQVQTKEQLDHQDEILDEAIHTSRWVRDVFSVELRGSVNSLIEPVKDLVDGFSAVKGGLKVLGWVGVAVKWLGIIATGALALWALIATLDGKTPPHV